MPVEAAFGLLGSLTAASAVYGVFRYRTPLNPLTVFCILEMGIFTILSGVLAYIIQPFSPYTMEDVAATALIATVFLAGTTLPFLFRGPLPARIFGEGIRLLGLGSERFATRFSSGKFLLLLCGAVFAFACLAVIGGGGLLWLTDPRAAYLANRKGAGPFYALTQWFLMFAMLYYLWSRKPSGIRLLVVLAFFCGTTYFMGSKNNMLSHIIITTIYYHFLVRRIPTYIFLMIGPLVPLAALSLVVIQGGYGSFLEALFYFQDYFATVAHFLARFDEFGYRYGGAWLSSLWFYVPRALYPNKPFEYGLTLIHQVLFPGSAALGHTPGLLPWALAYLDFGVAGVFFDGMMLGLWKRMAFEHFLSQRQAFFVFILMVQICFWPVWIFAPLFFVIVLCLVQSVFLRLRFLSTATVSRMKTLPES